MLWEPRFICMIDLIHTLVNILGAATFKKTNIWCTIYILIFLSYFYRHKLKALKRFRFIRVHTSIKVDKHTKYSTPYLMYSFPKHVTRN